METIPNHRRVLFARRRRLAAVLAFVLVIAAQSSRVVAAPQPLKFFKNYFVTGDYVVGGVGLWGRGVNGIATGTISMSGVPGDAEILSAYLYWQVVTSDGPESGAKGATFNGQLLSLPGPPAIPTSAGTIALAGNPFGTSPCWSGGGGTGSSGGVKKTFSYRADVKRFLPLGADGRHQVNRAHTIQLPDSGNSNQTPKAFGASLVVVFRNPPPTDTATAETLNAIVIYDGSYTLDNTTRSMSQIIQGFYDPASALGRITHIVGGAQANKAEVLIAPGINEVNAFQGFQGEAWDNVTRETSAIAGDALTTSVNPPGGGAHDCLTWSAIIYRTQVNDYDEDGLLDKWETSLKTLYDPRGNALPNLASLGAHYDRKDIFIEIGYMKTGQTTYAGVSKPAHTHAPTHAAIEKVGKMFLDAPVDNPNKTKGIDVHIDLGDDFSSGIGDPYLIRGGEARGGEWFDESVTQCKRGANAPHWICQFSAHPGTVGWKSGFRFLRDKPKQLSDKDCATADIDEDPLTKCERVFDRERKDMFRYVLFVHALGVPKEDCLEGDRTKPNFGFPDTDCQATNGLFHVPVTNTGIADFPGGDAMVALGGFDDSSGRPVGTDYMQAATLVHELGHTFQLRHGGAQAEPNCKPNYLSVMNYLFQLRGLKRNSGPPIVDLSSQRLGALDEARLTEPDGLGQDLDTNDLPLYRTGWYALPGSGVVGTPSTKHCDGTALKKDASGKEIEPRMVRVDSGSVEETVGQIDWTKSPATQVAAAGQDLNFNGAIGSLNAGFSDWKRLRLNQVGSRRNVGAWFWVKDNVTNDYGAFMGPLSLDTGLADMGLADMGLADMGSGDLTQGDLGRGDLNLGDLGRAGLGLADMGLADMGLADMGLADMGSGDIGLGDAGLGDSAPDGELSIDLIEAHGFAPPNELTAVVVGLSNNCVGLSSANCHRIRLDWTRTNLGNETRYDIYRVPGGSTAAGSPVFVGSVPTVSGQGAYSVVDPTELPNGVFTYIIAAAFGGGLSASDVQVTAVNTPPVAVNDPTPPATYTATSGESLSVPATIGVLKNDSDIDSPAIGGPPLAAAPVATLNPDGSFPTAHGTAKLNPDGSFTYKSVTGYTGPDSFVYIVKDIDPTRTSNAATVSITVDRARGRGGR